MARARRSSSTITQCIGNDESKKQQADNASRRRQGGSSWSPVHQELLPPFLRDNEFLVKGHRPQLQSVIECIKSSFKMHTETLNIWTHFLGCVGCVILMICDLTLFCSGWPQAASFSAFFTGAIFCLGASTTFHVFICHSERVSKLLAKLDYCGVICLIVSSFYPWLHYGFYCDLTIQLIYAVSVTVLGLLCVAVVLQDRFRQPHFRSLRAGLFLALGLTGLIPGIHYIFTDGRLIGYYEWMLAMGALYVAGGVIYAIRFPERWFPGMFDIWCQSHQILHICVLGGVLSCYVGISKLAAHRLREGPEVCNVF